MRLIRVVPRLLVVLATINLVLPFRAAAAAITNSTQSRLSVQKDLVHLSLGDNGQLRGALVDPNGKPLGNHPVSIYDARKPQAKAKPIFESRTDAQGKFVIEGLKSSAYLIVADESVVVCQCWKSAMAPPAARQQVLLVSDGQIERGQSPIGELLFANPIIMALLIVAAIAIPVAIHEAQDDAS